MKDSDLIKRTLNSTAVACLVYSPGIGYDTEATLRRQHHTGYIVLRLPWREFDIDFGETRYSDSGVAITELVSSKGLRFYVQSAAGDVLAAIHGLPQMVASPEVESVSIQQAIV